MPQIQPKVQLQSLCEKANPIVVETGNFIREQSQRLHEITIEIKDINSLVSDVDRGAEKQLVEKLGKLLPEAGFLTEEDTPNSEGKTWQWIIDPLDGTTNFLYDIPCFSVSIGLKRDDKLVLGIIYEIMRNELYYAWENGGAYLNNKEIHVSQRKQLNKSLLATGFPYYDFSGMGKYLKSFSFLMQNSRGIRRLGSAAVDLAYVACGRFDGFFEYSLNPWDVAGGAVLVIEAGGTVIDFEGRDNYLFGKEIIASNPYITNDLLKVLKRDFHGRNNVD